MWIKLNFFSFFLSGYVFYSRWNRFGSPDSKGCACHEPRLAVPSVVSLPSYASVCLSVSLPPGPSADGHPAPNAPELS